MKEISVLDTKEYDYILPKYKKYIKEYIKVAKRNRDRYFKKTPKAIEYVENILIFDIDELADDLNTFFYIISFMFKEDDFRFVINKFLIEDDVIFNIDINEKYLYNFNVDNYLIEYDPEYSNNDPLYKKNIDPFFNIRINNIYEENLHELNKSKYYKYLNFEKIANYINKKADSETCLYSIENLILFPVKCNSFEYLVKLGFYEFALTSTWLVDCSKNLKKFLLQNKDKLETSLKEKIVFEKFMTYKLCAFDEEKMNSTRIMNCALDDKHCLSKSESYYYLMLHSVIDTNVDNYLIKLIKDRNTIEEYFNYISLCRRKGVNLKIKENLMPDYFEETYYGLSIETNELENKDDKIKDIGEIANLLNIYENDKYIIFACPSASSLIMESKLMHNCVRIYYDLITNGVCQIYFMREKNNINKPLVTIEVKGKKVFQAYQKYNRPCTKEQLDFIKEFENNLTTFNVTGY